MARSTDWGVCFYTLSMRIGVRESRVWQSVGVLPKRLMLVSVMLLLVGTSCRAQTTNPRLLFALPFHAGALSIPQGSFKVTGMAAKSDGDLFGIYAGDDGILFSGSLFVWPQHSYLTAPACRDAVLRSEGQRSLDAAMNRIELQSVTGADVALVLMIPKDSSSSAVRAFVASGNLCADLTFSSPHPISAGLIPLQRIKDILTNLSFDATAAPTFRGAFTYATVEFRNREYDGAAAAYEAALKLVGGSSDPRTLRRVTTDQLSMALGLAGHFNQSKAVNEAAIAIDPTYPLYYYNLACANAEQGDAAGARTHLEQAFQRRANTLPGETLPDPATDPSIVKLQSNAPFWAFVQTLEGAKAP